MDFVETMFNFFFSILSGMSNLASWLTTSHSFNYGLGSYSLNPLAFLTIGGLIGYLGIAIVKWLLI